VEESSSSFLVGDVATTGFDEVVRWFTVDMDEYGADGNVGSSTLVLMRM